MSSLELTGHRYILYLEGSTQAQIHPSAQGMVAEKNCHVGQGSISDKAEGTIERFTFKTTRPTGLTPHGLAHLPDFERLKNGYTWETVHALLKSEWPSLLVDAYCADLLDTIETWQKSESEEKEEGGVKRKKLPHQILIPHLVLSRLSMAILEAGFADTTTSLVMGK